MDPRNFTRLFGQLCDRAGVRRVRLHGHVSLDAQRNALGQLGDLLDEDED